jgi:hypothetical protein
MIHKQSCHQHQGEDAPHTFQRLDSHIFYIESIFLIEAVGMLNLGAIDLLPISPKCTTRRFFLQDCTAITGDSATEYRQSRHLQQYG